MHWQTALAIASAQRAEDGRRCRMGVASYGHHGPHPAGGDSDRSTAELWSESVMPAEAGPLRTRPYFNRSTCINSIDTVIVTTRRIVSPLPVVST